MAETDFEEVYNELESRQLPVDERIGEIGRRIPANQRNAYATWAHYRYRKALRDKARAPAVIAKIQSTDFRDHASREALAEYLGVVYKAPSQGELGKLVPIGHYCGRQYAFMSGENVWNFIDPLDECYPLVASTTAVSTAGGPIRWPSDVYVGLLPRTYEEMQREPSKGSSDQRPIRRQYARCSGSGLLTSNPHSMQMNKIGPSCPSLRQPTSASTSSRSVSGSSTGSNGSASAEASSPTSKVFAPTTISTATSKGNSDTLAHAAALFDHPFFRLGTLFVREPREDNGATGAGSRASNTTTLSKATDYFIVISYLDSSVWIVYDAWYEDDYSDDDDDDDDDDDFDRERSRARRLHGRFKPEQEEAWAQLYGDSRRRVMAKLADHVHHWHLGSFEVPMTVGETAVPDGCFPVVYMIYMQQGRFLLDRRDLG
ncbi:MAG: hypothetical protein M1816_007324 [Peltula sp. TS41687]|nr:MAG: hypothetical protein M1816_007324 [Peltula sp. TS41687]